MARNYKNIEDELINHLRKWLKTKKAKEVFQSRQKIADHINVSYSHFNNIINGHMKASNKILEKIAILTDFDKKPDNIVKTNNNKEKKYMEFTEEFRKWYYQKQNRFRTQRDLGDYIGIDNSTINKYLKGTSTPKGKTRLKLYNLTNIELIKPNDILQDKHPIKSKITQSKPYNENIDEISKATKRIENELEFLKKYFNENKKSYFIKNSNQSSIEKFSLAFYNLVEEIIVLRETGVNERQELRKLISPKDVGYVSSFLKALFDEDKFTDFILFSKYEFEKKGEEYE